MPDYGVDDATIAAQQEEHAKRGRTAHVNELLREREVASRPVGRELSEEAKRSISAWTEHVESLNALVDAEIETLPPPQIEMPDVRALTISDTSTHVFGAGHLTHGWTHLGSGQASADFENAKLFAYNYTTGPARFTVAQIGVSLRPSFPQCKLSVRAYVRFWGYNILDHRVHQPGSTEVRRAWALGSVGLKVDSWNLDGSNSNLDAERWVDVWDRGEPNPFGRRDFDSSVSVSDGMIVEPLAIDSRSYIIWITCRVGVSADPGFEVSTYATSSISCLVPYFVVEEIPHW
jgi:hypothetical protein